MKFNIGPEIAGNGGVFGASAGEMFVNIRSGGSEMLRNDVGG
jgi:hypothetical protein